MDRYTAPRRSAAAALRGLRGIAQAKWALRPARTAAEGQQDTATRNTLRRAAAVCLDSLNEAKRAGVELSPALEQRSRVWFDSVR